MSVDTIVTYDDPIGILARRTRRRIAAGLCPRGHGCGARFNRACVATNFGTSNTDAVGPSRSRGCVTRCVNAVVENRARLAARRGTSHNVVVPRDGQSLHRPAAQTAQCPARRDCGTRRPKTQRAGQIQDKARYSALSDALAQMPERQAQAVSLRHLEGLSNPEIAEVMDISLRSVESLTARGKRALKDILLGRKAELGYDDD